MKYIETVTVRKSPIKVLHDIITHQTDNISANSSDTDIHAKIDVEDEFDNEVESISKQARISPKDVKKRSKKGKNKSQNNYPKG